ncbi:MAG: hypothetical protein QM739_19865 [Propionivibrio sp.]
MLIYLGCSALAAFLVSLVFLLFGEPSRLATTHLVFAVAILPLIVGAMTHFTTVLTRSGEPNRAVFVLPLALQFAGVLAVLHFHGSIGRWGLHAAAGLLLIACAGFGVWMIHRARRAFGGPHPGWRWYLAAVACLSIGLALVPAMDLRPEWWLSLRLLHLHLNTLGFIGLTALGTMQVLMPTVLHGPDGEAGVRLREDLLPAVAGVCLVALGAAVWQPAWWSVRWLLLSLGVSCQAYVVGRLGLAWMRCYGWRAIVGSGAALSLAGALCGYLLSLLFGIAHGLALLSGRDTVLAFVSCFLLPLVSGALMQLLPVWCAPGRRTGLRDRLHAILDLGGLPRTLLLVSGGVLLALGRWAGLWLSVTGLLLFLILVVRALLVRLLASTE